jgi:tetratricopeptide (TPR) repeat protein
VAASGHAQPEPASEPSEPAAEPELSERDYLARGKALYEAGDYSGCAKALGEILGPRGEQSVDDREVAEDGRLYYGACLLGSGHQKRADAVFRHAIRDNPQVAPNPLDFPQPVVERFEAVRGTMLEEIKREDQQRAERARRAARQKRQLEAAERARQQKLFDLAAEETIVVRNRRWLAAVPFGVGQFQNDSPALGWLFLVTEAAALGATIGGVVYELELEAQYEPGVDEDDLNAQLVNARRISTVSLYTLSALAVIGIAEAQLSFVPEFRRTRRRELPKELVPSEPSTTASSAAILVAPLVDVHGAGLAVGGRF